MMSGASRVVAGALALMVGAGLVVTAASAQEAPAPRKAFRVCQDPNNMPFSSTKATGFENKIAELFAKDLNLPVEYFSFPQRLAFVRNTLRYKLPGEDFRCDIVMSVPATFDQALPTAPYYHSTYALVYRKGQGLDQVKSGADLFALPANVRDKLRIGIYDRSPAAIWLVRHGMEAQVKPFPMMSPNPEQYPGEIIEKDLAQGNIDAAVVWGPIAGYYAKRVRNVELVVIPLKSEPGVKFDYEIAMGVRQGEREWKATVDKLLAENQAAITTILREYNVPLVDAQGEPVK